MANRTRDRDDRGSFPSQGGGTSSPINIVQIATLVGVGLLVALNVKMLTDSGSFTKSVAQLNGRIDNLNNRIAALGTEHRHANAPAPQRGPDPNKVHTVKTDGSPSKGPASAPIVIAQFSEFQCPFCARVGPTLEQIEEVYGDSVRIVWKNLPLTMHQHAAGAAAAAMAANEQGKFWEYHDKLFANQQKLTNPDLIEYARELKLDVKRFEDALNSGKFKAVIDADTREADQLGVSGTPAFFINGKFLNGAQPFDRFTQIINAELTAKGLPIPAAATAGGA